MAALFYKDQPRAMTEAGELRPGASLWFTATGTDNDLPVYADSLLTTRLRNPLPSDSAARFPPFWLDPDLTYRARLLDAEGAEIWERDPVGDVAFPGTFPLLPLNAAGEIQPFAELTFWNAHTTELQDVFSDLAMTTPIDQPVTANSAGAFSAIYVDDTKGLRVRLETRDGALVYDVDDLKVAPDGTISPPSTPVLTVEGTTTAELSWTASTPIFGDSLVSYRITRSVSGGSFDLLVTLDPDVLEYEDTTVSGGTIYEYRVIANATFGGDSAPSNTEEFAFGEDPEYSLVVLLLQIGLDGVMRDNSLVAQSVAVVGGGSVTSAVTLFGHNTFDNPGTSAQQTNYVEATAPAGTYQFTGQFCFEGWFHIDATTDNFNNYFTDEVNYPATGFYHMYYAPASVVPTGATGINSISLSGSPPAFFRSPLPPVGSMHHFAMTRDASSIVRIFINGVQQGADAGPHDGALGHTTITKVRIGAGANAADNGDANFHFGEVRITKGAARYTANFTPPTAPFAPF